MEIAFTNSDVSDFCRITQDFNKIHNPEFMKKNGKLVIVPGMLIFAYVANLAEDFLRNHTNLIEIYFGSALSAGEYVNISSIVNPETLEARLLAQCDDKDLLCLNGNYTKLCKVEKTYIEFEGVHKKFPIKSDIKKFADLIKSKQDIAEFLFAIAYSSHALIRSVEEPETQAEEEIKRLISTNKLLPVYQSLTIHMPNGFQRINLSETLDFTINAAITGKRDLTFNVRCEQNILFYNGTYKLKVIPEIIIIKKLAKDTFNF